jgi:polysaccharide pyruvyl transferase WcaK-like protein
LQALGASLVNLCARATGGGEVVLLLGNRDTAPAPFRVGGGIRLIPVVNCRLSPKARFSEHLFGIVLLAIIYRCVPLDSLRRTIKRASPWIRTAAEARVVGDIRGGDSFSDIYGLGRFLLGFLTVWSVVLVRGSIVQFPQTFGPYKRWIARRLARYLLRRSSVIMARDVESQKVAQDLVGLQQKVLLSPDVAFSLEAVQPTTLSLEPPLFGNLCQGGIIGLNVNGLMYNGGYTRRNMFGLKLDYPGFLPKLVESLLAAHQGELWMIPHTLGARGNVESDNEASEKLRACLSPVLQARVRIVAGDYNAHELKGIIGQCDFFIGSRMHSCIAALSQGIPCVGIAYSRKFEGVFDSVGMGEWVVDARDSAEQEAVDQVLACYRKRLDVRGELVRQAERARADLERLFSELIGASVRAKE